MVYGNVAFFPKGNEEKIKRRYRSDELSELNLAWGKMPAHPAMFIRKEVYDRIHAIQYHLQNWRVTTEGLLKLVRYLISKSSIARTLVKMQLGGASTGGLTKTILLNREVVRALRSNGICTNIYMILSKYPSKILRYFDL